MRTRLVLVLLVLALAAVAAAPGGDRGASPESLVPARVLAAVADLDPAPRSTGWVAGEAIHVRGTVGVYEHATGRTTTVPTALELRVDDEPARAVPALAGPDGVFDVTLPATATAGLAPGVHTVWVRAFELGDSLAAAPAARFTVAASADGTVELVHQFVSSTGWVKPGEAFPVVSRVRNTGPAALNDLTVTIAAAPSMRFTDAMPLQDAGTVAVTDTQVTWTIPSVPAGTEDGPGEVTLVTNAAAFDLTADPELVWKDLSSTATLSGTDEALAEATHGPKVIPPFGGFETSRYGDKPFPMVPAAYADRQPQAGNEVEELDTIVNDPAFQGSTFNLYQEMSFGQLFPQGVVPSAGIDSATYSELGEDMPTFSTAERVGTTCRGATVAEVPGAVGSPAFDTRISNGWYQLPGTTEYYGGDFPVFDLGTASSIDSACGQLGKGVYDAASAADPEIDYNQFDSDRDGVVDFFMLIFVGCGGNGGSQLSVVGCPYTDAPYDNIWPHSSSLEMQFTDAETGLRGFVSHDQLRSLTEVPQCFVDDTFTAFDDCAADGGTGLDDQPVPVRVGPYNVNPETVFESASVISHEYGHHLDLPDFYNSGFDAYGSFNLMAADYGQNMTAFSKQELGWVVPRILQPGDEHTVEGWSEIKDDTGEIHWMTPDGTPYVLSEANGDQNIRNGEIWAAKLPARQVLDPAVVAEQASGTKVLWSRRGNDFGCNPTGAHNIDLFLPELAEVADGAEIVVNVRSAWDIEWDWDYGFVLMSPDGKEYTSVPSANGYTTDNLYDPNGQQCFAEINNGLTGQSGAYAQGEPFVTAARNPAANDYSAPLTFLDDSFDVSALAGTSGVVRFSYFTDAAFDRPGWFLDDISVTVDGEEIFSTDLEDGLDDSRFFNGGCSRDGFNTAAICTDGWQLLDANAGDTADHSYYLELRDRARFDFEGYGQSDRGDLTWSPGLLLDYTDENHGFGNNGTPDHPAQHYLDVTPVADAECAEAADAACNDSALIDADGRNRFSDDADTPHLDNFADPSGVEGRWTFDYGCLDVEVLSMTGEDTIAEAPDLTADVALTANDGCAPYDVAATGRAPLEADVPAEARISVRVDADGTVTLDGSASTGDLPLAYAWDLGDGATADTQTVVRSYPEGTHTVSLTVTDADGDTDTAEATFTVGAESGGDAPLPATGGGLGLLALGLLGAASTARVARRR